MLGKPARAVLDAEAQVLVDRQVGEDLALLRHVGDARPRDPEGPPAGKVDAVETHVAAVGGTNPMMVLSVVERPEPLRPEQADDLADRDANPTPCRMWLLP